jgi:hypothetical protein
VAALPWWLLQIVQGEVDPQLKKQACKQLTSSVCQLLLWLTACWQPPGWLLTWQSLALPPAVAGGGPQAEDNCPDGVGTYAAASSAVQQLLGAVASCGVNSWEGLQQVRACAKDVGLGSIASSLLCKSWSTHFFMPCAPPTGPLY